MISDVPLGAFLSGGIDSSLVVSLMQKQSSRPVQTFSIGFTEDEFNEAQHAKAVAKHLGTQREELYVTPKDTLDVVPLLPQIYDEPFADSSQVPTYLVSKLARRQVTVSLSGDGGDEIFGGYTRYFIQEEAFWKKSRQLPAWMRKGVGRALGALPPSVLSAGLGVSKPLLPSSFAQKLTLDRVIKGVALLQEDSLQSLYTQLIKHWNPDDVLLKRGLGQKHLRAALAAASEIDNDIHRMMVLDSFNYLPDDILVKVDRAAMAVSLESRAPFLNHRVYEFAHRIPMAFKVGQGGKGKLILRDVLARYVPVELFERPKMGFGVPIVDWLRGPLHDWAQDLLSAKKLEADGIFNTAVVQQKLSEHLSGDRNWQYHLWDILMFQAWKEAQ
jgi:asparagine synthase (glutamine-hydrolysing)